MPNKKTPCGHPDICPADDFAARVKTDKLALAPPPPANLVPRPVGKAPAKNETEAAE